MNIRHCLPLLPALLLLCAAAPPGLSAWRASLDSVGPIHLGMTLAEAQHASGLQFVEQPEAGEVVNWGACHYAWPANSGQLRLDLALVLHSGRIARIEVATPEIVTASGAHVGDTEARLRTLYAARLSNDAHGHLLVSGGGRSQPLRFMMENGRMQAFHVGEAVSTLPGGGCT
jgi:hypothetical protein